MTTATREMVESVGIQMHQWTREGEDISGHLLAINKTEIADKDNPEGPKKKSTEYVLVQENGVLVTFLQTWELMKKLRAEHVGHFVTVKWVGTKIVPEGTMKLFSVLVSKERELTPDVVSQVLVTTGAVKGPIITDDDVPNF